MTWKQNRLLHNESVPVIQLRARLFFFSPIENEDRFFTFFPFLSYLLFPIVSLKVFKSIKKKKKSAFKTPQRLWLTLLISSCPHLHPLPHCSPWPLFWLLLYSAAYSLLSALHGPHHSFAYAVPATGNTSLILNFLLTKADIVHWFLQTANFFRPTQCTSSSKLLWSFYLLFGSLGLYFL